jgi:ferredoxin
MKAELYLKRTVPFVADSGQFANLLEFSRYLKSIDDATFSRYCDWTKNDFHTWVKDCVGDPRLARDIMMLRNRGNMIAAVDARIALLKDYVRHPKKAFIEKRIDMYVDRVVFHIDNELCCSCELCSLVCPKEAVEVKAGKKTVSDKCTRCGFCVQFCPVGAISQTYNGKEMTFYRDHKMLPQFPDARIVNDVKAIKYLMGMHTVKDKCPAGCEACLVACPVNVIQRHDELGEMDRIKVTRSECLLCGACSNACPYHLIEIRRTTVLHEGSDYCNAWNRAIEKLTRPELKNTYHNHKNLKKLAALINKSGLRKY